MPAYREVTAEKERLAINKWIGPLAAAVLIIAVGGWSLVRPKITQLSSLNQQEEQVSNDLTRLQKYDTDLNTLQGQYQTARQEAQTLLGKLDKMLPDKINNAEIFSEFQQIVENNGLTLSGLHISPIVDGSQTPSTVKSAAVTLTVVGGNYPALKHLLDVLEHNLRLTDIITLNFDTQVQTYSINSRIYSRQ